jgi:hypothetical protein
MPARAWRPTLPVLHCTTRSGSDRSVSLDAMRALRSEDGHLAPSKAISTR